MPHGRPSGFLRFRAREVDESGTVVLAVQESALDHDVEELSNAGRRRGVRQFGPNLLHRRPMTPMQDVHNLAFATGQMGSELFGHAWHGELFRRARIYSPWTAAVKSNSDAGTDTSPEVTG